MQSILGEGWESRPNVPTLLFSEVSTMAGQGEDKHKGKAEDTAEDTAASRTVYKT